MFLSESFRLNTQRGTSLLRVLLVRPSKCPVLSLPPAVTREQGPSVCIQVIQNWRSQLLMGKSLETGSFWPKAKRYDSLVSSWGPVANKSMNFVGLSEMLKVGHGCS